MTYDQDPINRDLRRVREQFEQERRYQQRIDHVDRIAEVMRRRREPSRSGGAASTSPVVWFFGIAGAFVGIVELVPYLVYAALGPGAVLGWGTLAIGGAREWRDEDPARPANEGRLATSRGCRSPESFERASEPPVTHT